MKTDYRERLKKGIFLFDSAMGTAIYERGIFLNRCYEEVSLTNPEIILDIHRSNIRAGAQAVTTNTFGANALKLGAHNLADRMKEINTASVDLARQAVREYRDAPASGGEIYIAGSIGPLGERLVPLGKITQKEAAAYFREHAKVLLEAGVDLILLETFRSVTECLLAAKTVRELSADIPIQAQFSLSPPSGHLSGNVLDEYSSEFLKKAIEKAVRLDQSEYTDVVGCNCGVGPADMLEILMAVRDYVSKPVSILPNAGFPKEVDGRQIYLADPAYFAEYALRFLNAGAAVIGGCCGTSAEHIRKMGQAVLALDSGRHSVQLRPVKQEAEKAEPAPLEQRSRLGSALARGEWITSVELIPPTGWDLEAIVGRTAALKDAGVTTVNFPDGPRASSRVSGLITASEASRRTGMEVILHICCRDRNLLALQGDILGAQAAGLRNLLFITGDPPKVGNYPDVTGVFDVDSIGLLSLGSRLNRGIDLGGNSVPAAATLVCGAGVDPTSPNLDREIERAHLKAEAGAAYFISQTVFDVPALLAFLEKIRDTKVPVIVGVWPLASYKNAVFLNNEVPGVNIPEAIMRRMEKQQDKESARREGVLIAREITREIRAAAAGIQISPPFGNVQTALDIITEEF